jgi:hypothetical protein
VIRGFRNIYPTFCRDSPRITSELPTIQDLSRLAARIKTATVVLLRRGALSAKWDFFRYRKLEEPPYLTRFREACTILPLVSPHGPSCQQNPCWLT